MSEWGISYKKGDNGLGYATIQGATAEQAILNFETQFRGAELIDIAPLAPVREWRFRYFVPQPVAVVWPETQPVAPPVNGYIEVKVEGRSFEEAQDTANAWWNRNWSKWATT